MNVYDLVCLSCISKYIYSFYFMCINYTHYDFVGHCGFCNTFEWMVRPGAPGVNISCLVFYRIDNKFSMKRKILKIYFFIISGFYNY